RSTRWTPTLASPPACWHSPTNFVGALVSTARDRMRAGLRLTRSRRTDVGLIARLTTASVGAAASRLAYRTIDAWDREREGTLLRTNHRGEAVTLAQGPATVLGSAAALTVTPGIALNVRLAGVLGSIACGGFGLFDDVAGTGSAKGLKGHFTA